MVDRSTMHLLAVLARSKAHRQQNTPLSSLLYRVQHWGMAMIKLEGDFGSLTLFWKGDLCMPTSYFCLVEIQLSLFFGPKFGLYVNVCRCHAGKTALGLGFLVRKYQCIELDVSLLFVLFLSLMTKRLKAAWQV